MERSCLLCASQIRDLTFVNLCEPLVTSLRSNHLWPLFLYHFPALLAYSWVISKLKDKKRFLEGRSWACSNFCNEHELAAIYWASIEPPRATSTKNSKLSTCPHARQICKDQSCFSREKLRIPGQYFYLVLAVSRLGVQYGNQVPLPQLESLCARVCSALYCLPGGTEVHAWKPTVFAGGKMIHPKHCSLISAEDGRSLKCHCLSLFHQTHSTSSEAKPLLHVYTSSTDCLNPKDCRLWGQSLMISVSLPDGVQKEGSEWWEFYLSNKGTLKTSHRVCAWNYWILVAEQRAKYISLSKILKPQKS